MLTGGRGSGRGWPLGSGPLSPFLTSPLKPCTHPPWLRYPHGHIRNRLSPKRPRCSAGALWERSPHLGAGWSSCSLLITPTPQGGAGLVLAKLPRQTKHSAAHSQGTPAPPVPSFPPLQFEPSEVQGKRKGNRALGAVGRVCSCGEGLSPLGQIPATHFCLHRVSCFGKLPLMILFKP